MTKNFFKFPSTPHLAKLPGVGIRDDKVLTGAECVEFLRHEIIVEEKVDGANLGILFDSNGNIQTQNRGNYLQLPGSGQWKKLDEWLTFRTESLWESLSDRYILFGEWCYAQHSIFYDSLPDWFLGFDVYDMESASFLSSKNRDRFLEKLHVSKVPTIAHGHFSYGEVEKLLLQSKLTDQAAEGIYLRVDNGDWLGQRAKLVRPSFIQAGEQHWSRYKIRPNQILPRTVNGADTPA